ncbi:MAG: tetratricopeptide repeat protein [Phycisphaerae bacterium]|nr:tetratricopeptide repeat protein [Phycisphaerae bacterium]
MRRLVLVALTIGMGIGVARAAEVRADSPNDPNALALEQKVRQYIETDQNYQAAVTAYAQAARANPAVQYYRDQFALLRSVAKMQAALASESVPEKWKAYADAVRVYHYSKGYYQAALKVDQAAQAKFNDPSVAIRKIETLLLVGQDGQAQPLVQSLSQAAPAALPARWQTLRAVVLSHTGQTDQALAAVANLQINAKTTPASLFDLARIYKASAKVDEALNCLRLFLEHTVPTEMATSRNMITLCADFRDLHDQEAFKTVLTTQSKVAQSGCTGGSSCSSCALKGKCSSSK